MKFLAESPVSFASPWWLLLLLIVPFLAMLEGGRGGAPAVIFSSLRGFRGLGRESRARIGKWMTTLFLGGMITLILGLARPQMGKTISKVEASGIDIILALDVSGSMFAEDFTIGGERASRLEVVKQVTQKFIEARPNDRLGIVCFAGRPYLVSPLTLDHDWLLQNLERVKIGLVEDGTAIGSAIASASNRLKSKEAKSRIVLLLTDGDNNAGKISPITAAEASKALGIKVYTIGAGTKGFAPMPMQDAFGRKVYRNMKVTVDEDTLKKVATMTGAEYYRATDTRTLTQIFEEIDKLEKSTVELTQYKQYRDLYAWLVGVGLGMLGLRALLAESVGRRLP